MKKQFILGFTLGAITFGAVGAFAGQYVATENPFPVQLNGSAVSMQGYNIDGSTYFKLRDVADTVGGFEVGFDNGIIQLSKDGYQYTAGEEQAQEQAQSGEQQEMVWVGDTGTKYHNQGCATLKGGGHQITLQQALEENREPCKICRR